MQLTTTGEPDQCRIPPPPFRLAMFPTIVLLTEIALFCQK
jgi:hypothetical protein